MNSYIDFIEGGQILEDYPNSKGRDIVIEIVSAYSFSEKGKSFMIQVMEILKSINVTVRQKEGNTPAGSSISK